MHGPSDLPKRYLDVHQAADYIGVTPRTLEAWRHRGGGPVFLRISNRLVKYRIEDLDTFMESKLRTSTSDNGDEGAAAPSTGR
jgi:hypothetical protein